MIIYPAPTEPAPEPDELLDMITDSGCEATDGCYVELDGTCEHGHPSWLLEYGMI